MALFAGLAGVFGTQSNKIRNEYESTINQTIQDTMSAEIKAAAQSICNNQINIEKSECCSFSFGEQYCESSAVNEVTADVKFQRKMTQALFDSVKQEAIASNEKLGFGQKNDISQIIKKTMNLSMQSSQVFNTDCSKDAYGINSINIKDVYCGKNPDGTCQTKAQPDFQTEGQTSRVAALGNCVASFAANNDIAQSLTSLSEQTAVAKNVGVDPLSLMLAFLAPFLAMLLIPLGIKLLRMSLKRQSDRDLVKNPEQEKVYKGNRRYRVFAFITFVLILIYMVALWPLGYSFANGYAPFSALDYRENARLACDLSTGTTLKELNVINRFMWIDPLCLTLGPDNTSGCSPTQQQKSYSTCGIYSKTGVCKSSQLAEHKTKYATILTACSPLEFLENDATAKCDSDTLSKYIMPREVMGNLCRRCERRTGDDPKYFGLFSSLKSDLSEADKKDCKPDFNNILPDKCYNACSGSGFSTTQYFASGTETISGQQVKKVCAVGETNCVAKDEFKRLFPTECQQEDYMEAKQKFLTYQKYCLEVNLAAVKQAPAGETLLFSEQCPPNPFDYFTLCNPSTFECSYTAQDPSDPIEVANCKNDFTTCQDESYLADKTVQSNLDANCLSKKKKIEKYEKDRTEFPVIFGIILGFLVVLFLFFLAQSMRSIPILTSSSYSGRSTAATSSAPPSVAAPPVPPRLTSPVAPPVPPRLTSSAGPLVPPSSTPA